MDKLEYPYMKKIGPSMKYTNTFDLECCFELLNTNNDVNVQVKLISMLSVHLMLDDTNKDNILTHNPLYDKISTILANCPSCKATVVFNFLSALLYVQEGDSDRRKTLVVYARNMIRSSGCLSALCGLFVSSMMNRDAWRALCRCVAETCRGIETNQSYCTHLVPVCVQRCSVSNIEVLIVLQSLLLNHKKNIQLFIQCQGMKLFQRELLQHGACLQLLATIVESSPPAVQCIRNTSNICERLRYFLQMYGPQSQLGQWATIILYHTSKVNKRNESVQNITKEVDITVTSKRAHPSEIHKDLKGSTDTTMFFQNVMREIIQGAPQKEIRHETNKFENLMQSNQSHMTISNFNKNTTFNKTVNSFIIPQIIKFPKDNIRRNSNRENMIYQTQLKKMGLSMKVFRSMSNQQYNQPNETVKIGKSSSQSERPTCPKQFEQNLQRHCTKVQDLSFTFLENKNITLESNKSVLKYEYTKTEATVASDIEGVTKLSETHYDNQSSNLSSNYFNPVYASTPKKCDVSKCNKQETTKCREKYARNKMDRDRKQHVDKLSERHGLNKTVQEMKRRSMSGRFFNAINESCTTLVKTVKNLFRPKTQLQDTKDKSSNKNTQMSQSHCSYSFTKYMRKRDEFLKKKSFKSSEYDFSVGNSNSCHTCNDTMALKVKLTNDKYLKQTVRKLKLGVNLYGCDFKKISRTMWPRDSYMTPVVLYRLYRKLLIK